MPLRYLDWITRDMLRAEPDAVFVFGDNVLRVGLGGQAGAMRGEPNAFGVATLYSPGSYYREHDPIALAVILDDLGKVGRALIDDRTVYVPRDGLGTGIARLNENAPALHRLIVAFFRAAPGEPCPWKD